MQKSSRNIQSFQEGGVWQEEVKSLHKSRGACWSYACISKGCQLVLREGQWRMAGKEEVQKEKDEESAVY